MIGILLTLHEKGTSIILNTPMYPEMMGFITDVLVMESGKNLTFGPVEEVYAEALCKSPVRMHILAQMEKALEVLKENPLVDRVTVDGDDVIFRFNGGEKEEAEGKVAVRSRFLGDEGQKSLDDFIDALCKEIRTKEIRRIETPNNQ